MKLKYYIGLIDQLTGTKNKVVQDILNTMDCPLKVHSGEFDRDMREQLTFFQKEYGYKYQKPIPATGVLDDPTWDLLETFLTETAQK